MRWGTVILTISLLIILVFASGCSTNMGTTKLDFGNSNQSKEALACFSQAYGDPYSYNGPPRFIAPLVSTGVNDSIPIDKVSKFSTDSNSIFFWVIYQNFQQGDDLKMSWIFKNSVVTTVNKKTEGQTGAAFGEFVRPDAGWPVGTHTIKIEGKGTTSQVTFEIVNGPTEAITFDFANPKGITCQDLIAKPPAAPSLVVNNASAPKSTAPEPWISGIVNNGTLSCTNKDGVTFLGSGENVSDGTVIRFEIFDQPTSTVKSLPTGGMPLGQTIVNADAWNFTWNGYVPGGYTLKNGGDYLVKAKLSETNFLKFAILYQCPSQSTAPEPWIGGIVNNGTLSCTNKDGVTFSGSGGNVSDGTVIRFEIFDQPTSAVKSLPTGGMPLGQTIVNANTWKFAWNGYVPGGYTLKNGGDYLVKAKLSETNFLKFAILYQCPSQSTAPEQWIGGNPNTGILTCTNKDGITFSGSSGNVSDGTVIRFEIFDQPTSTVKSLPTGGMPLGQATVNANAWKFTWNGYVPGGYTLKSGDDYLVKAKLSETNFLKFGILYQCPTPTTCPTGQMVCNGQCVMVMSNPNNCGSCGNVCTGGRTCMGTSCVCNSGQMFCNSQCVDIMQNSNNCGGCGVVCGTNQYCLDAKCVLKVQSMVTYSAIRRVLVTPTTAQIPIVR